MGHMDTSNKILIVDDDREIRTLLAEYLDHNGYTAIMAADGPTMWAAMLEHQFELIVLDLNLPGDDGLTLCRNLRGKSNIPVIMLTARGEPLDRIIGLEMGADDYLPKPLTFGLFWILECAFLAFPGQFQEQFKLFTLYQA